MSASRIARIALFMGASALVACGSSRSDSPGQGVHPVAYADPALHGADAIASLALCQGCHQSTFAGGGPLHTPSCNKCHADAGHPDWQTDCTFCHGDAARAADPGYPLVGSPAITANLAAPPSSLGTNNVVGAHVAHVVTAAMASPVQCSQCHGPSLPTNLDHVDGSVLIGWGNVASAGNVTPSPAGGNVARDQLLTCANYCHGATLAGGTDTSPSWNGPARTCTSCHGLPPPTGRHDVHVSLGMACSYCHFATATEPVGTSNVEVISSSGKALHVNGVKDVVLEPVVQGTWDPTQNGGKGGCASLCHGYGGPSANGTGWYP